MIKLLRFVVGVLLFILVWGISLELISCANTLANMIGVLMAVSAAYTTIKTKCLTDFNFKKNEE